jgi:hypothetical protein
MSNSNPVSHTDADAELAEYVREIRAFGKQAVIEIGKRLIKAKAIAGHGNWLPWLDREFGWTDDTALNFMRVATLAESRKFRDLNVPISGLDLLARAPRGPEENGERLIWLAPEVVNRLRALRGPRRRMTEGDLAEPSPL